MTNNPGFTAHVAPPAYTVAAARTYARVALALRLGFIISLSLALEGHVPVILGGGALINYAARIVQRAPGLAPRLSIGNPYHPCTPRTPVAGTIVQTECEDVPMERSTQRKLRRLMARAEASAAGPSGTEGLHMLALVELTWGDPEGKSLGRAISLLERASRLADRPAPKLTDLAAAYLIRAEKKQDPLDLVKAMEAATGAVAQDPKSVSAHYNLALALDRNGLDSRAAAAWKAYLALDYVSGWADEARARLRALELRATPTAPASADDTAAVAGFAERNPQDAQLLGWDHVLGEWGEAMMRGDSARAGERLRFAQVLGTALMRRGLDATLADQVHEIHAQARNPPALRRLAGAHQEYAAARAAYLDDRKVEAGRGFARVRAATQAKSPLYQWTTISYGASVTSRDPARGEPILRGAIARGDSLRHPALTGRGHWLLGTSLLRQTRYHEARDAYVAAARHFDRAREHEHRGAVQVYAGTAEHHLANVTAAYASFHAALMTLRPYRGSRWLHSALWAQADAAAGDGYLAATTHILDEDVEVTRLAGNAMDAAEAQTTRARLLAATGFAARAVADLDAELAPVTARVAEESARAWLRAELWEARGVAAAQLDPARATSMLDSAVAYWTAENNALRLLPPLVARADASLALGKPADARRDLSRVLTIVADERGSLATSPERMHLLERVRGVAGRLALRSIREGHADRGLLEWEEARAALLPHALAPPRAEGERLRARRGETAVVHAMVGDTLVTWTVSDTTVRATRRIVPRAALLRNVERARSLLEQPPGTDPAPALAALQVLYEQLVRPVESRLGPAESLLLLVPDPALEGIPFSALHNTRSNRYLIEDHPLRVAATLREQRRTSAPSAAPALLVAANEFDRRAFPELGGLPGALAEVRALTGTYRGATELVGARVTREALLAALPLARVTHFAGHALFEDQHPERSRLVLAADRVPGTRAELGIVDIEQLRLPAGSLVVLSACQTIRSPAGRSGGFAGLAGAFLAAGARGVVGSLWKVDDEQTRVLMTSFHQLYQQNQDGPGALRSAQLQMLHVRDPRTSSPAAWAGFRYTGN